MFLSGFLFLGEPCGQVGLVFGGRTVAQNGYVESFTRESDFNSTAAGLRSIRMNGGR